MAMVPYDILTVVENDQIPSIYIYSKSNVRSSLKRSLPSIQS